MKRSVFSAAAVSLFSLCMYGCSLGEPHISVFQGNYAFGRGGYQEATVSYLRALSHDEYQDIIHYNLGNVYHALGEVNAATDAWETALGGSDPEVLFNVYFNRGVLMYESGKFQESYQSFRDAVRIMPNSIPAKLNLELAYERISSTRGTRSSSSVTDSGRSRNLNAEEQRILEFVRRREVQSWERPQQDDSAVPDW
ncbi:MAG: tetratricopeptide repeat protein [Spirochaeta sp.]